MCVVRREMGFVRSNLLADQHQLDFDITFGFTIFASDFYQSAFTAWVEMGDVMQLQVGLKVERE